MSILGAMSTAISGLNAQSDAFTNISDNVANSSTTGFKGVNTSFIDYLTQSSATLNQSGSVVTRPDYTNDVQGTIEQSTNPLALAITGGGFFAVAEQSGTPSSTGTVSFSQQQYYTRAGDFAEDRNGYLVNSAGEYLQGYIPDPTTGVMDTSKLVPIQVATTEIKPVATSAISISANVPATPSPTSNLSSELQVYDAGGTQHALDMQWAQTGTDAWTLTLSSADNVGGTTIGTVGVAFNPDGTLAGLSGPTGAVAITGTGTNAQVTLSPNFGGGAQPIALNLGQFGTASGVTQFAGTDYLPRSSSQNGVPAGNFTGIQMQQNGDVVASFDTGQTETIAHVPLAMFADPDQLQRQNGQAFTATTASGAATLQDAGVNGAGALVTGSVEGSNVDIASELSKLIVAQQAYGANAKLITSAQQMLTTAINMDQ